MACYRGEYVPNHPEFSENSKALCKMETSPVPFDAPDIEYTEEDEKAIEAYTRKYGQYVISISFGHVLMPNLLSVATAWPSVRTSKGTLMAQGADRYSQLGTCAMKPREHGGVVDSRLNVYGVEKLKVAGTSCFRSFRLLVTYVVADLSIPPSNVAAVCLFISPISSYMLTG